MKIKIICEPAANWEGDLEKAKEFIREAKRLGLFAVKFQMYNEEIISVNPQYFEYLVKCILTEEQAKELFEYGKDIGQEVFFTCMYPEAVNICERIGVNYYKIRFADNQNYEILDKVKQTGKHCLFSDNPCKFIISHRGLKNRSTLLCISEYPAEIFTYFKILEENYIHFKEHDKWIDFPYKGISDHTHGLFLYKYIQYKNEHVKDFKGYPIKLEYFEKHMRLNGTHTLEDLWSVTFSELEIVLNR